MEKTIQLMKESGLFDSLVQNIREKDMPVEAVTVTLDHVCELDNNFEDTFFNEMHNMAMETIMSELMTAVNCLPTIPTKGDLKQGDKYEVNFDNFEQVLMDKTVQMFMKKIEDLFDETIANALKNHK